MLACSARALATPPPAYSAESELIDEWLVALGTNDLKTLRLNTTLPFLYEATGQRRACGGTYGSARAFSAWVRCLRRHAPVFLEGLESMAGEDRPRFDVSHERRGPGRLGVRFKTTTRQTGGWFTLPVWNGDEEFTMHLWLRYSGAAGRIQVRAVAVDGVPSPR
jgi:hypothetical protein